MAAVPFRSRIVRPTAAAIAVVLSACGPAAVPSPPPSSTAPPPPAAPAPPPRPVAPLAVARDVDLFGPSGGDPLVHVTAGTVIDDHLDPPTRMFTSRGVLDVLHVHVRVNGEVVEGYVPVSREAPGRGIGLFAVQDTPVLAEDGSAIAFAHAGAFLPWIEAAEADDRSTWLLVALPPFPLTGRVPRASLAMDAPAPRETPPPEHVLENRRFVLDNGHATTSTVCDAPVAIVGAEGGGVQVSQSIGGIEVRGVLRDAGEPCTPRAIVRRRPEEAAPRIPTGWTAVPETKLTALARSHGFYRITRDGRTGDASCSLWSFRRSGPKATLTTTYVEAPVLADAGPVHTTVTYEVELGPDATTPAEVLLDVLSSRTLGANGKAPAGMSEGTGGDAWTITIVGQTPEGLEVLDPSPGSPVVAYDPADRDVWYGAKSSCERALRAERDEFSGLPPAAAKLLVRAR